MHRQETGVLDVASIGSTDQPGEKHPKLRYNNKYQ